MADDISQDMSLVYDGPIDTGSSLLFYVDSPLILLNQDPEDDFVVRKFGRGDRFLTLAEFISLWNSSTRKLITEEGKLALWRRLDIARTSGLAAERKFSSRTP